MQIFSYHSQKLNYNHHTKTAFTTIDELFYSAGKKLGWSENIPGVGLNLNIISFILKTKCTLVVKIGKTGHEYFIQEDKLRDFLMNNNCDYIKSGIQLKVISIKKFIRISEVMET